MRTDSHSHYIVLISQAHTATVRCLWRLCELYVSINREQSGTELPWQRGQQQNHPEYILCSHFLFRELKSRKCVAKFESYAATYLVSNCCTGHDRAALGVFQRTSWCGETAHWIPCVSQSYGNNWRQVHVISFTIYRMVIAQCTLSSLLTGRWSTVKFEVTHAILYLQVHTTRLCVDGRAYGSSSVYGWTRRTLYYWNSRHCCS